MDDLSMSPYLNPGPHDGPTPPQPPPPPVSAQSSRWRMAGPVVLGGLVLGVGAFLLGHSTARRSTAAASTSSALSALVSADSTSTSSPATCAPGRHGAAGTLKAVNGTTLTVTGPQGANVTVKTDSSTKVIKTTTASISNVKANEVVAVDGTPSGQSGIAAERVVLLPGGPPKQPASGSGSWPGPGPRASRVGMAVGTVQSISGTSFVVKDSGGANVTVTTSSSTSYYLTQSVTLSQLTLNQPIVVAGRSNSDGSITALAVAQGGFGAEGAGGFPGVNGFGHRFRGPFGPGGGFGGQAPSTSVPAPASA